MNAKARKVIKLVAAHPLEVKGLRQTLAKSPVKSVGPDSFLFKDTLISITITGMGQKQVTAVLYRLLGKDIRLSMILNIGFAGALNPRLGWGEWLLCEKMFCATIADPSKNGINGHFKMLEEGKAHFTKEHIAFKVGALATADWVCESKEEREQLCKKTGAWAVDMEAYHIARIAFEKKIPLLSVKIISDAVDESPQDAIKSRAQELCSRIALDMPSFIMRLACLDESNCSYCDV